MKKKLTAAALVISMLAIMLVGATMAYFTDETQTEENTFTIGKVDIELTEPEWDIAKNKLMPGTEIDKDPTITVAKESEDCWVFMKVEMNKFNSWLRLVAIQNDSDNMNLVDYDNGCNCEDCQGHLNGDGMRTFVYGGFYQDAIDEWFADVDHDAWKIMNFDEVLETIIASVSDSSVQVVAPIFGYKTVMSAEEKATLFTSVTMPASVTSEQLADSRFNTEQAAWKMNITGYAVQSENIANLDAAYAAIFAE